MAGRTQRFNLNKFGGSTLGTISDDGQKYTGLDRETIDRLFAQVEGHDHKYRSAMAVSLGEATGTLVAHGGTLQGGYTYYYRYSVVDQFGMESIASAETTMVTPSFLAIPGMVSLSGEGLITTPENPAPGLAPGMYYYALTAIRGTEETPLGQAALVQLQAGQDAVRIGLPAFNDAESFRVWRMGSTESGYTKIGIADAPATEVLDEGLIPPDPCACDLSNMPPTMNTGTASYAIEITIPEDVDLTTARSWRLFRSVYPSIYPTMSLVHEVVEREDEWVPTTPLLRVWRDRSGILVSGKPLDTDENMRFLTYTLDSAVALPDPDGYPENYPITIGDKVYALRSGEWVLLSGTLDFAAELPDPADYPENYPIIIVDKLYALLSGEWVLLGGGEGASLVLTSPNGSRFVMSVGDDGLPVMNPTLFPGPPAAPANFAIVP